jgi:hypothetical protein
MSSRKGGKKGPRVQAEQSTKQAAPTETLNPLLHLIVDLFEQIFPKAISPHLTPPTQQVILTCAKNVEKVFRQLILDSQAAPLLRYVIQLSTVIQQTTGVDAQTAKKVFSFLNICFFSLLDIHILQITSYFFTFILDELRRHWDEYGLREDEVHADYRHDKDIEDRTGDADSFTLRDISQVEYDAWCRAWNFLNP